ncbi:MAG TPA: hypothetical protein ENK19_11950 [Acidobacteria bacterium]|nr:hypothetical protein [Acidobacteriota bacterium]
MFRKSIVFAAAIVLLASGLCLAGESSEPMRWLNVKVNATEDHANVSVRVPMSLVTTVLDAVKTDGIEGGKIKIDTKDVEIDWPKLLQAIKDAPDGRFITVDSDDADVKVEKRAGMLRVDVQAKDGDREKVKVLIPAALLDAIRIDDHGRLDVRNLLAGLDSSMVGDLVRVEAPDASVRIWID